MAAAVRVGDPTTHGGTVTGPGVGTVLIGGMPAAVAGDMHTCPMAAQGHVPSPFAAGSATVLIGGRQALRAGVDVCGCGAAAAIGAPTAAIGAPTVSIG